MSQQHTPTPWRWADWNATFGTLEDAENMKTLETANGFGPEPRIAKRESHSQHILTVEDYILEADKAFIVQCVNSHAALVEALKCALTHAGPGRPDEKNLPACCQDGGGIITCSLEQMLEAALKLAGEG